MIDIQTGEERRIHQRYRVHLAVEIEAGERSGRIGVSQDASVDGLLFNTRSRFTPGDDLTLTLHLSTSPLEEARVRARVVRVESVDAKSSLPWRYLAAVRFHHPLPQLVDTIRDRIPTMHDS